jgi:hypothetical protein
VGHLTPVTLRVRSETDHHEFTSGFKLRVHEAEVSVGHPNGRHELAYALSMRDLVPNRSPGQLFLCAASPQCVPTHFAHLACACLLCNRQCEPR